MTLYSKKDIVQQARNLAKMISETEEVDFFKRAEAQINENEKVSAIINQIKALQKQAVNLKHYEKLEALKQVESKIDALQEELEGIPIIQEFRDSQIEVNDLLQLVAHTISNQVTNEIITSTDGNLLTGETGSKVKHSNNSCSL
ncbi:RicAFT regulatory complex protein RicA family protein [Bacillus sp. 1021]|uniref:RicAFT regulatory complex protein RicA family protein n=1 Tax=Bacillus sp. 1021 TaxID=2770510 RepID=UPI00165F7A52|nr:RicAFT regulatory complex protein RicA family protein [Bacillus sp. 1021]MBD0406350.1 RicAFT regulatory complex protein RicA family protein [Bacillus sp. 1021]